MQLQREPLDPPEPSARAAEELAEVVAGDVLHDFAARARTRPVGQHDGDADHEVAHRPEAVAAAGRKDRPEAFGERRSPGGSSENPAPMLRERRRSAESAGRPRRCTSGRPARVRRSQKRSASPAFSSGCARYGPGTSPQSAASGTACPDSRVRADRTRAGGAAWSRCRPRRTSGASRTPCRCLRRARR